MLTEQQLIYRRRVRIHMPLSDEIQEYVGDEIVGVNANGVIVVAVKRIHIFYPWSRIVCITFSAEDVTIQDAVAGRN